MNDDEKQHSMNRETLKEDGQPEPPSWDAPSPCPDCGGEAEYRGGGQSIYIVCTVCGREDFVTIT